MAVVSVVGLLLGACGQRPHLICTYETLETCERAAEVALDALPNRADVASVTIKPPDGTWRTRGIAYLALAMVHGAGGEVTLVRVSQVDGEPMRAEVLTTD